MKQTALATALRLLLSAKAMMTMQGRVFTDCSSALLLEGKAEFPRYISTINICRYNSLSSVKEWIAENSERLQCVVSSDKSIANAVGFGRAQYPALNNYADDIDVMKFLLSL